MEIDLSSQKNLEIQCPIAIIQSLQDDIVPLEQGLEMIQKISSDQVELVYVKFGNHRLSDTKSLEVIIRVLENIVSKVATNKRFITENDVNFFPFLHF